MMTRIGSLHRYHFAETLLSVFKALCLLMLSGPVFADTFNGVWSGTVTSLNCGNHGELVLHVENSSIDGTILFNTWDSQPATLFDHTYKLSADVDGDTGAVGDGVMFWHGIPAGGFTGTFSGASVSGTMQDVWECQWTFSATQQASYDGSFDELWPGDAFSTTGCLDFSMVLTLQGSTLVGSLMNDFRGAFQLQGSLSGNTASFQAWLGSTYIGSFSGTADTDTVEGTHLDIWNCQGDFYLDRLVSNSSGVTGWFTPLMTDTGWYDDPDESGWAIRSGYILDNQDAQIGFAGTFDAGTVRFAVKASSEANFDYLRFYIDGVEQAEWSGEVDWTSVEFPIPAGTHTLVWSYEKDESWQAGADAAWIRDIDLPVAGIQSLLAQGYEFPPDADAGWLDEGSGVYRSQAVVDDQRAQLQYDGLFTTGNVTFDVVISSEQNYDWLVFYIDGVLRDAWSGVGTAPNLSYPISAGQHVLLWSYEKDGSVSAGDDLARISNVQFPEVEMSDTLLDMGFDVVAGAESGWIDDEAEAAFRSGAITHNEDASIEYTGNFSAGKIGFDLKVSSEQDWDFLRFYIDGVEQGTGWSGTVDWTSVEFDITVGAHTLVWSYEKDINDVYDVGDDTAWIKNLRNEKPSDEGYDTPSGTDAVWFGDFTQGSGAYRAGDIGDNQDSQLRHTGDFSQGVVRFDVRTSGEQGWDFLRFYIDDLVNPVGEWSGEADWITVEYPLAAGNHTLLWSYEKDGSVSAGLDTVWIRDVDLPPVVGETPPDIGIEPTDWSEESNGVYRSGAISHSQSSEMVRQTGETDFSLGLVRFAFKVSSEEGYDFLRFYIDDLVNPVGEWSGEMDWTTVEFPVTSGDHTLKWVYEKDESVSSGSDAAWVGQIELPLADTGGSGTDDQAPVTTASPQGGTYNTSQQVVLTCSDVGGSGCKEIRYTLNGADPDSNSTLYSSPISIDTNRTFKFRAYDNATPTANVEAVKTAIYTIDTTPPAVNITSPSESVDGLTQIAGTVTDIGGTGVNANSIRIVVSKWTAQGSKFLNEQDAFLPAWSTLRPQWNAATDAFTYDASNATWDNNESHHFRVTATDVAGNEQATSRIAGGPSRSTQFWTAPDGLPGLNLSSRSITPGGTLDVSGALHLGGSGTRGPAGLEIELKVVKPGDIHTPYITTSTDSTGAFQFQVRKIDNMDVFGPNGPYKIRLEFDGNPHPQLESCDHEEDVTVGHAGYAIIIQGKIANDPGGLASHKKTTDQIYQYFRDRGFLKTHIKYLAFDSALPQDAFITPSPTAVENAIKVWAKTELLKESGPLYIVLVNHGNQSVFHLDNESLSPGDLDGWLDNLETNIVGMPAATEKRVILLGSCFSGSFIPGLYGPNRVVVTSATATEQAYKGANESDNIPVGSYFMEELFRELALGSNLRDAFRIATDRTEVFTQQSTTSANSSDPFLDGAVQHPLLEDSGNDQGSNLLTEDGEDGQVAKTLVLGVGTNIADFSVEFTDVTETRYLENTESLALLWAKLDNPGDITPPPSVAVRAPTVTLETTGSSSAQVEITLNENVMAFNTGNARWEYTYNGFGSDGRYDIYYLVRDANGRLSPIKRSMVYRRKAVNTPPAPVLGDASGTWDLISPVDGSQQVNTTLVLDWEDAADPDALPSDGPITYNVFVATDQNFNTQKVVFQRGGLLGSSTFVTGLTPNIWYWWKVEAVDPYGEKITSAVWKFRTSSPNSAPGIIKGLVISDLTSSQLVGALVSAGGQSVETDLAGRFTLTADQATAVALNVSASGYVSPSQPPTVSVLAGQASDIVIYLGDNYAPTANNGSLTTNMNTAYNGILSWSDQDSGDSHTVSIVTNGSKGSAIITNAATGAFTYTPTAGASGDDSFTFKVNDGTVDSNTATVSVKIINTAAVLTIINMILLDD